MINHVVLFKLKEFESVEEKKDALNEFKSKLMSLKNIIPELKYIEVGCNHELIASSYDLCLISHFESIEDLDIYSVHPEHLKVGEFVKDIAIERSAVDYVF